MEACCRGSATGAANISSYIAAEGKDLQTGSRQNCQSWHSVIHSRQDKEGAVSKHEGSQWTFRSSQDAQVSLSCFRLHDRSSLNQDQLLANLTLKIRQILTSIVASNRFKFIDLFAGIGGMRLSFQRAGGKCVFSSEWNKYAQQTYAKNFGEYPEGDITKIKAKNIPDHDVLAGGFPCQPFSIAGVSKKRSHVWTAPSEAFVAHSCAFLFVRCGKKKQSCLLPEMNVCYQR